MINMTINGAIIEVLKAEKKSLSAKDIYSKIIELDLYKFKAAKPYHIVLIQLRRHCINLDFPTAHKTKLFILNNDGTYGLKPSDDVKSEDKNKVKLPHKNIDSLRDLHTKYLSDFKSSILLQLKQIDPNEFENFGKKLLQVYGFKDVNVTKKSRDGGIDGYGKLKVGLSYLNVAFQCKRWKSNVVSRVEVDKFRGATQGDFEQAIFFTTSHFSKEALGATTKKGAIPIILIDGNTIIDLMIEKKFGIDMESLPIYYSALDDILF